MMASIRRLHYAWIVAAVTFVVGLLTAGVRAAPGVLIVPLEQEFDWSRATISFAIGVNLLLYGLVGPFAAALMDRFGVRRTMTLALGVTAAAVALSPAMRQAWQLVLLWGVVVGLGTGVIGAFIAADDSGAEADNDTPQQHQLPSLAHRRQIAPANRSTNRACNSWPFKRLLHCAGEDCAQLDRLHQSGFLHRKSISFPVRVNRLDFQQSIFGLS